MILESRFVRGVLWTRCITSMTVDVVVESDVLSILLTVTVVLCCCGRYVLAVVASCLYELAGQLVNKIRLHEWETQNLRLDSLKNSNVVINVVA